MSRRFVLSVEAWRLADDCDVPGCTRIARFEVQLADVAMLLCPEDAAAKLAVGIGEAMFTAILEVIGS